MEKQCKRKQKVKEKISYFLDSAERPALSRWEIVREEKVMDVDENLLKMREREKYEKKWIKKEERPEELLLGIMTWRDSVWNDIDWEMRRWLHFQNTVQDDPTGLQCSVHPWCLVMRWFSAGKNTLLEVWKHNRDVGKCAGLDGFLFFQLMLSGALFIPALVNNTRGARWGGSVGLIMRVNHPFCFCPLFDRGK